MLVRVGADGRLVQRTEQVVDLARALGDNLAVILKGHGAVIVGDSIEAAFVASILLEENATRLYQASLLGEPSIFEGDALRELKRQTWQPKVISKIWNYHILKADAAKVL